MRCKQCRKRVSKFAKECPYCHMPFTAKKEDVEAYLKKINYILEKEERKSRSPQENREQTQRRLGKRSYIVIVCAIAVAAVGARYYMQEYNKWNLSENTITYLSEDKLVTENLETGKKMNLNTFQLSEFYEGQKEEIYYNEKAVYREFPEQGRIYYAQVERIYSTDYVESFQLYKKETKSVNSKPELIDDSVLTLEYDALGNVYYVPLDQRKLVKYDGTKKQEVQVEDAIVLRYNANQNVLFVISNNWRKAVESGSEAEAYSLSVITLSDMSVHKISDYTDYNILFSEDGEQICYLYKNVLYRYEVSTGTITEIAKNVTEFQFDQEDTTKLYYIKYELEEKTYYDLVIDKYKEQDKAAEGMEDSNCSNRNLEREILKKEPLYLMRTALYCCNNGGNQRLKEGIGQLYPVRERLGSNESYLSVNEQTVLDSWFVMSEYGIDSKEDVEQFYMDSDQYGEDAVGISFYSVYDSTKDEEKLCNAMVAFRYEEYSLIEEKLVSSEERVNYYKQQREEASSQTAGEVTCYYDLDTETLSRRVNEEEEKEVVSDVFSYLLYKDGTLLVMAGGEDSYGYDLYKISPSGEKKVIQKNVWGIFGENLCVVAEYSEVEQRTP